MNHAEDDNFDGDIFIYRGGRAPQHISHARIDKSVDEIEDWAFDGCRNLVQVDTHDGIRKIGAYSFNRCTSLRQINLKSVVEFDWYAFGYCFDLESVEFGDRLETIGFSAFSGCSSLKHLKLPSIISIGGCAFYDCESLTDIELSDRLQRIGSGAFWTRFRSCDLTHIAVPLKRNLFEFNDTFERYNQFDGCDQLTTVDLVGGTHRTVAALHMESWRTKMIAEINRINQVLPNTYAARKGGAIRQWMNSVMDKLDHYKAEHSRYVKEGITLLELALWKAKLGESEEYYGEGKTKKAKINAESARKDKRMTCGAEIVIKNVLPYLQLE